MRDVLFEAGGLTPDAWLDSAQIFRTQPDGTTKIFSVNLREAVDGNPLDNLLLEPRDLVYVPPRETHVLENTSGTEPAEYVVARDSPHEDAVVVPWAENPA